MTSSALRPWLIVFLLTLFMILAFADRAVLGFAAVPLMKELNLTPSQFGLAASAMYWLYPVGGILGGFAVNRWPTKWVLAVLATVWAVTQFPFLWASSLNEVVVARALLGLGEGPAFAVALHACFKWFEDDRRAVPTSLVSEGAAFGIIIASPIVAYVLSAYGWRSGFGLLGALTLVWVVIWLIFSSEGQVVTASAKAQNLTRVPYRKLLLDRTFIGNTLAGFAVACGITVFLAWLPPYLLRGLGYSTAQAGWLTTLPWLASIVLVLAGSALSQRLLRRGVGSQVARAVLLYVSLGAGGLATIAMTYLQPGTLQLLLLCIGFGLPTLVWTLAPAVIAEITPVTQRGAMLGLFTTVANTAAGSLAPYFMGLMVERGATQAAGYATGFAVLGALQLVFAVIAALLIRPEGSRAAFVAASAVQSSAAPQPSPTTA
ncbi:MAG TPA: MFS transporter [Pseudolabrys sp.]|nr:MFS transporter [Pseudolabrys sp.]